MSTQNTKKSARDTYYVSCADWKNGFVFRETSAGELELWILGADWTPVSNHFHFLRQIESHDSKFKTISVEELISELADEAGEYHKSLFQNLL